VNILGFYKQPSSGELNAMDFIEQNILGMCNDMLPKVSVSSLRLEKQQFGELFGPMSLPVVYNLKDEELVLPGKKRVSIKRTFLLSVDALEQINRDMMMLGGAMTTLEQQSCTLSNIWTLAFRGVRQFLCAHEISSDQLLPHSVLLELCALEPGLMPAAVALTSDLFKGGIKPVRQVDEFIAVMLAGKKITAEQTLGKTPLAYDEIKRILRLRRSTITIEDILSVADD
jgi:hypothetical protein